MKGFIRVTRTWESYGGLNGQEPWIINVKQIRFVRDNNPGTRVVFGDGTDDHVLVSENIDEVWQRIEAAT